MFVLGMISYRDIKEVLDKRGLKMTISGDIQTEDGRLYSSKDGMLYLESDPIYSRREILDI